MPVWSAPQRPIGAVCFLSSFTDSLTNVWLHWHQCRQVSSAWTKPAMRRVRASTAEQQRLLLKATVTTPRVVGWLPAPCRSTAVRAYNVGISEMFNDMYQHNQDLFLDIQVFSYHIVFCIYWFSATESSSPCTLTSGLLQIYDCWK